MTTIIETIYPYSFKREELQIGVLDADKYFTQDRILWNVLKDSRLKVSRSYAGSGASKEVTFTIEVPDNYPLAIVKKTDCIHEAPDMTIIYDPDAAEDVVEPVGETASSTVSPANTDTVEQPALVSILEQDGFAECKVEGHTYNIGGGDDDPKAFSRYTLFHRWHSRHEESKFFDSLEKLLSFQVVVNARGDKKAVRDLEWQPIPKKGGR